MGEKIRARVLLMWTCKAVVNRREEENKGANRHEIAVCRR